MKQYFELVVLAFGVYGFSGLAKAFDKASTVCTIAYNRAADLVDAPFHDETKNQTVN